MKKFIGILLAVCMIITMLPTAFAADVTTISSLADLKSFRDSVNSGNDYAGKTVTLTANINLNGEEWTPIGTGTRNGNTYKDAKPFKGTFNGGNYTISGLKISKTVNADYVIGLFGVVDGGTVKNLKLANVNINVHTSVIAGGAIGLLTGDGVADNITVSGSISAYRGNGGIVGRMLVSGTIKNCTNNATMAATGGANVGGIAGAAYYTAVGKTMTISNCVNNGTVTGVAGGVGGITGLASAHISNCTNNAAVVGANSSVGGIVGEQQNYGSVIGCTNNADVKIDYNGENKGSIYGTGGIIGWIRYNGSSADYPLKGIVEVKNNTNSGSIDGANDAGGIIGTVYHAANVSENENTASSLKAINFAGGIVANFQYSDTLWGDPIPQMQLNTKNNISTTAIENIEASCTNLYVYDNSSGTQDGTIAENSGAWVAQVGDKKFATLEAAIKAAAPSGTVEIIDDIVVDKWIMFAEEMTIGNGKLITLNINGMTINGNNHTLTVKSIESAKNGAYLFYDAENLNINDLTIKYADNIGGIGLQSGTLSNVTFDGGVYGVLPGTGDITITGCTFKTNGTSVYFEQPRDNLVVTGNTFNNPDNANVILLRGTVTFTNNTIKSGRTVNVVSGSPVVSGNDFGDVRFKVYNVATATISNNEINNIEFEDDTPVKSTFTNDNTFSTEAQAALKEADVTPVVVIIDITFDANEGECETKSVTIKKDNAIGELPEATREGYKFLGWFTAKVDGEAVTAETVFAADATVYAQWEEIPVEEEEKKVEVNILPPKAESKPLGSGILTAISAASNRMTITATAGEGGRITSEGAKSVIFGSKLTYAIFADAGYEIDNVVVDGEDMGAIASYTFKNIRGNHTISVTFKKIA